MLQPMSLCRVFERGFLSFDGHIIHTYISLCARAYGGNAAVLAILGCQRDNRVVL